MEFPACSRCVRSACFLHCTIHTLRQPKARHETINTWTSSLPTQPDSTLESFAPENFIARTVERAELARTGTWELQIQDQNTRLLLHILPSASVVAPSCCRRSAKFLFLLHHYRYQHLLSSPSRIMFFLSINLDSFMFRASGRLSDWHFAICTKIFSFFHSRGGRGKRERVRGSGCAAAVCCVMSSLRLID